MSGHLSSSLQNYTTVLYLIAGLIINRLKPPTKKAILTFDTENKKAFLDYRELKYIKSGKLVPITPMMVAYLYFLAKRVSIGVDKNMNLDDTLCFIKHWHKFDPDHGGVNVQNKISYKISSFYDEKTGSAPALARSSSKGGVCEINDDELESIEINNDLISDVRTGWRTDCHKRNILSSLVSHINKAIEMATPAEVSNTAFLIPTNPAGKKSATDALIKVHKLPDSIQLSISESS